MPRDPKFDDGFSEMLPVAASHGIGHNQGPEWLPIGKELEDRLKTAHKKAMKRAGDLIDAPPIAKVDNVTQLKAATERVRQYQASLTELDGQRKAEKEPFRLGGAQVDGFFNEKAEELALLKQGTERLMNSYNDRVRLAERRKRLADLAAAQMAQAEVARKAREAKEKADAAAAKARGKQTIAKAAAKKAEAEILLDQVEDAKAVVTHAERRVAAPAADLTRARSANAVQSQQEFVDFRDLDRSKISLEALRSHIGIDHLAQAVRSYITANNDALKEDLKNRRQPLVGVEFFLNSRTRVGGG
jgi:hypothetical protein